MDTTSLLLEFCDKAGLPGLEPATQYAKELLSPYGEVQVGPLGSVRCTVKEPVEGQPHILMDAHLDEIGLLVTYIDKKGFVHAGQFGGTDPRLLSATRVSIHTADGEVTGVIGSVPPHLSAGKSPKAPRADEIYIDVGMSEEQAKKAIRPGDRITFHHAPVKMLNGNLSAKALDDRSGCVALLKALEYMDGEIPCGLTVVFSTMEEIGGMGAQTTSYTVDPTHALAVDVSFAKTPDSPPDREATLGGGPLVGIAPVLDHPISRQLEALAKEKDIPVQLEVMSGRTGTNIDSMVTNRHGIRCALLSIPQRYMHMPIEMVSVDDVENTGKLIAAWVQSFGEEK